ncbi:hypothetical protein R3P38DRAFT_2982298 [Favolaschia claudopus]|uniref:F-box domain-containing protein n=1 Tax=Favolaschia claudopus TaxID=2862362 RepID=A0AAW0AXH6_9AGAR
MSRYREIANAYPPGAYHPSGYLHEGFRTTLKAPFPAELCGLVIKNLDRSANQFTLLQCSLVSHTFLHFSRSVLYSFVEIHPYYVNLVNRLAGKTIRPYVRDVEIIVPQNDPTWIKNTLPTLLAQLPNLTTVRICHDSFIEAPVLELWREAETEYHQAKNTLPSLILRAAIFAAITYFWGSNHNPFDVPSYTPFAKLETVHFWYPSMNAPIFTQHITPLLPSGTHIHTLHLALHPTLDSDYDQLQAGFAALKSDGLEHLRVLHLRFPTTVTRLSHYPSELRLPNLRMLRLVGNKSLLHIATNASHLVVNLLNVPSLEEMEIVFDDPIGTGMCECPECHSRLIDVDFGTDEERLTKAAVESLEKTLQVLPKFKELRVRDGLGSVLSA